MKNQINQINFSTELLSDLKRKLIRCRIALIISLTSNVIAAIAVCRLKRGKIL